MIEPFVVAAVLGAGAGEPDEILRVGAALPAAELVVGQEHSLELTIEIAEGWSAAAAGIPRPLLQIDVPESITLSGEVVSGHQALARNEFLREPFERAVQPGSSTVRFTLDATPGDGERIGLNVIAYLGREDDDGSRAAVRFVRRRLELPLRAGATAVPGDPAVSGWGRDTGLQIGDRAAPLTLPRADGTMLSLSDYLGRSNIVLTTYRAFW